MGRAGLVIALVGALSCAAAQAHEPGTAADRDVWLDKPAQHRDGIRTLPLVPASAWVRLPALVVADPRRELRVAAVQGGVIEAAGTQLPVAGQVVRAGQVLAWLRPVLSQPDRRDMGAELAVAQRDIKQDRIQIERYGIDENQKLEVKLSTPNIQIVTNYRSAKVLSGELTGAMDDALPLLAPRAGTILRSPAVAGTVAAAGQTLFEIDAPGALAVELEYVDDDIDAGAVRQALTAHGRALPLRLLGASYDSALRSHRALYAVAKEDAGLSVNQPLLLDAPRQHSGPPQFAVPASAVFSHDGHSWVWLHQDAQHFVAQQVALVDAADGGAALIGAGLQQGQRVVVEGVDALNAAARARQGLP